jgi:phosphohistidine swiveling domain-containing protein
MYDQTQFTPLYMIDKNGVYLSDASYFGSMELSGYAPESWITYTQNKPESFFFGAYPQDALDKEAENGFKIFTDKDFLQNYKRDVEEIYKRAKTLRDTYFTRYYQKESGALTDAPKDVANFLRDIQKTGEYIISRYILTQPQRLFKLEDEVKKYLPNDDIEAILSCGRYLTHTSSIRKTILELAEFVAKDERSVSEVLSANPEWQQNIQNLTENYGFLNWTLLGGDLVDHKYIEQEVARLIADSEAFTNDKEEMETLLNNIQRREELIRNNGDKREVRLADLSGHLPVLRFDIHTCLLSVLKYFENFALAAGEKHGFTSDQIHSLYFDDIIQMIELGKLVPKDELDRRQKGFLRVYTHDGVSSYVAEDAHKIIGSFLEWRKKEMTAKEKVDGTLASWPDKAITSIEGSCFVLTTAFEADKLMSEFKDGQILVATQTHPNIVPIMKKAKAIVTDEGGLTCHAAIVSRELNKPCIIGTKIGTKIFHTGDSIQLDLQSATVRRVD